MYKSQIFESEKSCCYRSRMPSPSRKQLLQSGSRKTIAVYMIDWSEWPRQVARGVQRFAHDRSDWRIYFAAGEAGAEQVVNHPERFDGIVTASLREVSTWKRILQQEMTKVVAVTSTIPKTLAAIEGVRVNDAQVAEAIGRHLTAGGFRHLAFAFGPKAGWRNLRAEALVAYAAQNGCSCEVLPLQPKLSYRESLRSLARTIAKSTKPMAIVTWNLSVGRLVVEACRLAKVDVPSDVAVVSWDDDPIVAETLEPTVSAAVLPAEKVGFEAASLLDRLMSQKSPSIPSARLVSPSGLLHIRQSSDVGSLKDRDVFLVMQYIREHGTEPLRIDRIANALHLSRRTMERNFRRITGKSVHDVILSTRLERAKQLLIETEWTTSKVAQFSGLGTEQSLRQNFVKFERITPGLYRARFRQ